MKKLSCWASPPCWQPAKASVTAPKASLDGEVFYLQRIALPPARPSASACRTCPWPMHPR